MVEEPKVVVEEKVVEVVEEKVVEVVEEPKEDNDFGDFADYKSEKMGESMLSNKEDLLGSQIE